MNKETFDKIEETLKQHIVDCMALDGIKTTEDLKKWTIGSALELQRFCRQEEAFMTKFIQCDLYHLIGMGDLTPPQMMKLTYLTKDWLKYRGTIKTIAMNLDKISQLPAIPVAAAYKLHCFDDLALFSNSGLVEVGKGVPYILCGNTIRIKQDRLQEFVDFWSKMTKSNYSLNNLLNKAAADSEYGGIKWTTLPDGDLVGTCTSCTCFNGFIANYKLHKKII